jgi:tripartite-type tricarboxylate transporter receptor subunit TctC
MRNNPFQVHPFQAQLGRRTLLTTALALGASQLAYPLFNRARAQSESGTATNAVRDQSSAVARFYEERDITLLVASAPGGINDLVGRLAAKHIVNFIPGKPNIVVQNLRASGIVLANRLYSDEPKDGSVIAILERSTPQLAVISDPNVRFDPLKLTWLGSVSSYAHDAYVLEVNSTFPAKTAADLRVAGGPVARVGTTGAGSTNAVFTDICRDVLGLNIDNIRGYRGAAGVFLAQQRGELDGQIVGFSSLKAGQATLWKRGFFRPLIAFGRSTRLPELPDVPTGRELTKDPKAVALIEFAEAPFHMALPFVAPPDVPSDRANALRTAFMEMTKSPAFVEDAHKLSLDVSPIDGAAVRHQIEMMQRTPKEVIAQYTSIVPLSD